MADYQFGTTKEFDKSYQKYIKNNLDLKERIDATIIELLDDPFYPGLRTHKVNTKNYGSR